jgi:hypothetical protein
MRTVIAAIRPALSPVRPGDRSLLAPAHVPDGTLEAAGVEHRNAL